MNCVIELGAYRLRFSKLAYFDRMRSLRYAQKSHMNRITGARVYLRVSTDDQDLQRQDAIVEATRAAGYYVARVYREKASGARADRPELLSMIDDLQPGEVVVAEKIDDAGH